MHLINDERNKNMKKFKLYDRTQANNGKTKVSDSSHNTPQADTKTVSVKVPGEVYDRLNQIKNEQGFKSVYEIMQLLVVAFIRHTDRAQQTKEQKAKDIAQPIADEIADMFSLLANTEPTPWQEARPTAHKPRKATLYI